MSEAELATAIKGCRGNVVEVKKQKKNVNCCQHIQSINEYEAKFKVNVVKIKVQKRKKD